MSAQILVSNLKALRKKRNLSQQKFADEIGKPIKRYAAWEEGRGQPNIDDIISLASKHNITIDSLLTVDLNHLANKV